MFLYMHGFASGPRSAKARFLAARFAEKGVTLATPSLTPGEDGFERSSPSSMLGVAQAALASPAAAPPPHAIVGSSLGAYLAAVAASRDPAIERLVLLAPAFRLFERWDRKLTATEREEWRTRGREVWHHDTERNRRLGWQFHEDAKQYPAIPEVKIPVLCIAGRQDDIVPLADVEAFVERTPTAKLLVLEDGHGLEKSYERVFEEAWGFLRDVPR